LEVLLEKKSLFYAVKFASRDDLKKLSRQIDRGVKKLIDPWHVEAWYPSVIVDTIDGKIQPDDQEFDLGFVRATSHAYLKGRLFKKFEYNVNREWLEDWGNVSNGKKVTYGGYFEKSENEDQWLKNKTTP
jgi:hypothetical protein